MQARAGNASTWPVHVELRRALLGCKRVSDSRGGAGEGGAGDGLCGGTCGGNGGNGGAGGMVGGVGGVRGKSHKPEPVQTAKSE